MTPETQRIAIAEACGWTNIDTYFGNAPLPFTRSYLGGTDDGLPEGDDTLGHAIKPLPDYLNDLNAMHVAEMSLSDRSPGLDDKGHPIKSDRQRYREQLCIVALMAGGPIHATATQRAEAFLRTLNLYVSQ